MSTHRPAVVPLLATLFLFALSAPTAAQVTLPWSENFDSTTNATYTTASTIVGATNFAYDPGAADNGRVRTRAITGNGGSIGSLAFDTSSGSADNFVNLTLDLSSYNTSQTILLNYYNNDIGDETHSQDQVWVRGSSVDSWLLVESWQNRTTHVWIPHKDINLTSILVAGGQSFSATTAIRFGQYDTVGISGDGLGIDDVCVRVQGQSCPGTTSGTASIGDRIFIDANGNGIDDGESGYPNAEVLLRASTCTGVVLDVATTNSTGAYDFTGLAAGTYCVDVSASTISYVYTLTTSNEPLTKTLTAGEDYNGADFGYQNQTGSIGDRIFNDANGNGTDDSEAGISGVQLYLRQNSCSNGPSYLRTTSATGAYDFTGIAPGTWCVDVLENTLPAGYTLTTANEPKLVTLPALGDINNVDFGYQAPAPVLPFYEDFEATSSATYTTAATIVGATDFSYDPATVDTGRLRTRAIAGHGSSTGVLSMDATGGNSDNYVILELDLSAYAVASDTVVLDYWFIDHQDETHATYDTVWVRGSNTDTWIELNSWQGGSVNVWVQKTSLDITDALCKGPAPLPSCTPSSPVQDFSSTFQIRWGQYDNTTIAGTDGMSFDDVCVRKSTQTCSPPPTGTASIGDRVYNDVNGNGADDSEAGLSGVQVHLRSGSCGGAILSSKTTTSTGAYDFTSLAAGTYCVDVNAATLPSGYVLTTSNEPYLKTLTAAEDHNGADFGYQQQNASIGDRVFHDVNKNGTDDSEAGLSGVTVQLRSGSCSGSVVSTKVTTSTGAYDFTGLAAGTYCVDVTAGVPAGYSLTTSNEPLTTTIAAGQDYNSGDFGYALSTGVTLPYIEDFESTTSATYTTASTIAGATKWSYDPGAADNGRLRTQALAGNGGSTGALILDTSSGYADGFAVLTLDLSSYTTAQTILIDYYINDIGDETHTQDKVHVRGSSSDPWVVVENAWANNSNHYTWMPHKNLDLSAILLANSQNFSSTTAVRWGQYDNASTNADGLGIDDVCVRVAGQSCGGSTGTGSIGDRVWNDINGNGTDDSEAGLAGVQVMLKSGTCGGVVLDYQVVPASGAFDFTNLAAGTYCVDVNASTVPSGYYLTTSNEPLTYTLAAAQDYNGADFGYQYQAGSIGDRVWNDANGNGIDDSEAGISGVQIYLRANSCSNGPSYGRTTLADGSYDFTNIPPGTWCVDIIEASLPAGYTPTTTEPVLVTLPVLGDINTADFGYCSGCGSSVPSIGDRIWNDANGNGTDDSEAGISGVTVNLRSGTCSGSVTATKVTTSTGAYDFTGLTAGTYCVDVDASTLPAGFVLTTGNEPLTYTVGAAEDFNGADFGYQQQNASIGDRVFDDANGNGTDDSESGIQSVTVWLKSGSCSGSTVSTKVTTATGAYDFTGLAAGTYCVDISEATLPAGYSLTTSNEPKLVTLTAGQDDNTADFGYSNSPPTVGTIGDRVWDDLNNNGVDDGEPGLNGIEFFLRSGSCTGSVVDLVTSNASGAYDFTNVSAGTYCVDVRGSSIPSGYSLTTGNEPLLVTLAAGQDYNSADFGYHRAASIGDRVYDDTNGNGFDDGEPGLSGVNVRLRSGSCAGSIISSQATSGGAYDFTGLSAGTYCVDVQESTLPPGGYALTSANNPMLVTVTNGQDWNGSDFGYRIGGPVLAPITATYENTTASAVDEISKTLTPCSTPLKRTFVVADSITLSDVNVALNISHPRPYQMSIDIKGPTGLTRTIVSGNASTSDPNIDAIIDKASSLPLDDGDRLDNVGVPYYDRVATPYVMGGGLSLDDFNGTDSQGTWELLICDWLPGYHGTFHRAQLQLSGTGVGGSSVGNRVWLDANANGIDDGEAGISGVRVDLRHGSCAGAIVDSKLTSATGAYNFTAIRRGQYCVDVDESTLPVGAVLSGGLEPHLTSVLTAGQAYNQADFGYRIDNASVGDRVWNDVNSNGSDDSEPGLAGVRLVLRQDDCSGPVLAMQITDTSGAYDFTQLGPGDYCVDVDEASLPAGSTHTGGTEPRLLTLNPGQDLNTVDVGYNAPGTGTGSIGDLIYEDVNTSGTYDAGDLPLPGIVVELQSAGCTAGVNCPRTTTDSSGQYLFGNLPATTFNVKLVNSLLPTGTIKTTIDPINVALGAGQNYTTADFGLDTPVMIRGCFWEDKNYDGIRGPGEDYGISDGVSLRAQRTVSPLTTYSASVNYATGCYEITGFSAAEHTLSANLKTAYSFSDISPLNSAGKNGMRWHTLVDIGGDEQFDNDFGPGDGYYIHGGVHGPVFTHNGIGTVSNIDVGYVWNPVLGDKVWHDVDQDGTQDASEPGVPGVTVEVWRPDGTVPYYTTVTDHDGTWEAGNFFSRRAIGKASELTPEDDHREGDMLPGEWYVKYILPNGTAYQFSPQDAAGDDALDSDANASGQTDVFTLLSNSTKDEASDPDYDAGVYTSCSSTSGKIKGIVFQDYNGNGFMDPLEGFFAGTVVKAYDKTNSVIASTTTASDGTYALSVPNGKAVRIEFSSLANNSNPGPVGNGAGATVQFATSPACGVNLAITRFEDYCQPNPRVASACYVESGGDQSLAAILDVPWDISEADPPWFQSGLHNYPADASEIGSVYGLAYHRSSQQLLAGAMASAGTNLPPDGLGAIYSIDYKTTPETITLFIDVAAAMQSRFGISNYSGTIADPPPADDPKIAKVGLGDIELSDDQQTLWVMSIADSYRELLELPLGAGGTAPAPADIERHPLPLNQLDCTNDNDIRPWGLGMNHSDSNDDLVYVGVVCSAESTGDVENLRAYVYTFNPTGNTWAQIINMPIAWKHYDYNSSYWQEWEDSQDDAEPVIADIEFDRGDMVLGIRARGGDSAHNASSPTGDMIRVCKSGAVWEVESNGTCGGRTTLGANSAQGIGGGEYYWADDSANGWGEIFTGGMATRPGFSELVAANKDGHYRWHNGFSWVTSMGNRTRMYDIFEGHGNQYGKTNGLGDVEVLCDAPPIEIGNRVWADIDENGIQDPGESPLAGVALELVDASCSTVASAVTNSEGEFYFIGSNDPRAAAAMGDTSVGQVPGSIAFNATYYVKVLDSNFQAGNALDGYEATAANQSSDLHDSDASTVSCGTRSTGLAQRAALSFVGAVVVTGGAGANNHALDLGFGDNPVVGRIGDRVWFDVNRDGEQQGGEEGIAGVDVRLYVDDGDGVFEPGGDDTLSGTRTTNAEGGYGFFGLLAGDYWVDPVESTLPTGFAATAGTPAQLFVPLASGQDIDTADFGYAPVTGVALGDFIWHDTDGDGLQDPGEAGIGGVTVTVTGPGSYSQATTTAANGSYLVSGITTAGDYTATVSTGTLPAGLTTTPTNFPTAAHVFTVDLAADVLIADYGFTGGTTGTIGDFVWHDVDGDGVQDAGEPGIQGVTVDLTDNSGEVLATMTTDASGAYDFTGLFAGNFRVEVTDLGGITTGLTLTTPPNPTNTIALAAGQDYNNADFGYASASLGTIGNFVWHDTDGDGVFDDGEHGLERVVLGLWKDEDSNGVFNAALDSLQQSQLTDRFGGYLFKNVNWGSYFVIVHDDEQVTDALSMTSGTAGQDNNSQSSPYPVTITASRAPAVLTADFGFTAPGAAFQLSGTVWFDNDGDGTREPPDESGVGGATVELYRDMNGDGVLDETDPLFGVVTSQTTSPGLGYYEFTDLPNGTDWIVVVDTSGSYLDGAIQTTQTATGGLEPVAIAGANSPNHDFGFTRPSTDALVSDFDVTLGPAGVQVEFATASEVGTVGFWVFREYGSEWTRVNDDLVLAVPGAGQGANYLLPDTTAEPGVAYDYWLLEVELSGAEQWHGPFTVAAVDATAHPVSALEFAPRGNEYHQRRMEDAGLVHLRSADFSRERDRTVRAGEPGYRARLEVDREGVYRVTAADIALVTATTRPTKDLVGSGALRVVSNGEEVSWWAEGANAIRFYAPEPERQFAEFDVYFIEMVEGTEAGAISSPTSGPTVATSHFDRQRFEEDIFYATAALRDETVDLWYWKVLAAGNPDVGTQTFDFDLIAVDASGQATLEVELFGATTASDNPDHGIILRINGALVGNVDWDGDGTRTHTLTFDGSVLQANNTLEIEAVLHDGVSASVMYVDAFSVTYRRQALSVGDQLHVVSDAAADREVTGFSTPTVRAVDVTDRRDPLRINGGTVDSDVGGYSFRWHADAASEYFVYSTEAISTLVPVAAYRPKAVEAEYLVFAPPELLDSAFDLASYRAADGYATSVVELLDVWDEYSDGLEKGAAIREYLTEAWNDWATKPQFAVILGKGTLDFRNVLGGDTNLAPPEMVATPQGLFASDAGLGDVEGDDGVPEIIVGRIPAVSEAEVLNYLDKMAAYEANAGSGRVLLAADNADEGGAFEREAEEVAGLLDGYEIERVYLEPGGTTEARAAVRASIEEGVWLVNYVGHGGLDRFAAEGLLTTADVGSLGPQGHLPIVASMTCSVGRFELPNYSSLSEALVTSVDRGAIAVWAPSGLSISADANQLNRAFVEALRTHSTLGEAMREAMQTYEGGDVAFPHMLKIYNLLGDPALKVEALPLQEGGLFSDSFESGNTTAWSRVAN